VIEPTDITNFMKVVSEFVDIKIASKANDASSDVPLVMAFVKAIPHGSGQTSSYIASSVIPQLRSLFPDQFEGTGKQMGLRHDINEAVTAFVTAYKANKERARKVSKDEPVAVPELEGEQSELAKQFFKMVSFQGCHVDGENIVRDADGSDTEEETDVKKEEEKSKKKEDIVMEEVPPTPPNVKTVPKSKKI
jgi:hypothetical protein